MSETAPAPDSFRAVIDCWPSRADLQRDVAARVTDRPPPAVRMWYADNSIPRWWFEAVVKSAKHRNIPGVTKRRLKVLREARSTE